MFYCEKCRKDQGWPEGFSTSYGPCEICKSVAICHDVPSNHLPLPKTPTLPKTPKRKKRHK